MSGLNGRVSKLEKQIQAQQNTGWIVAYQDLDDPDLFLGTNGRQYRRGDPDWPENIFIIVYDRNWRPRNEN